MRNKFFIYINKSRRNSRKHCGDWELTGYRSPSKVLPSTHHGRGDIKRDWVNKVAPKFLQKRMKQQDKEKLSKKWIQQKYRKYPNEEKTTYSWRRVVGRELRDGKRDNACSFQHLLETLEYLCVGQLKG